MGGKDFTFQAPHKPSCGGEEKKGEMETYEFSQRKEKPNLLVHHSPVFGRKIKEKGNTVVRKKGTRRSRTATWVDRLAEPGGRESQREEKKLPLGSNLQGFPLNQPGYIFRRAQGGLCY